MSAPTEFDKELDKSIVTGFLYGIESHRLDAEEVRLRVKAFRHTSGYQTALRGSKQAVDKHVIGEDLSTEHISVIDESDIYKDYRSQNKLKAKQRQALWGTK